MWSSLGALAAAPMLCPAHVATGAAAELMLLVQLPSAPDDGRLVL
jgi:hypothetical protein